VSGEVRCEVWGLEFPSREGLGVGLKKTKDKRLKIKEKRKVSSIKEENSKAINKK